MTYHRLRLTRFAMLIGLLATLSALPSAADWPMWRYDAGRTAVSPDPLPRTLHLQWVRHYPALEPAFWQVRQDRVQFDAGYEPVVAGKLLFVGSSRNDRLTALDTETGQERWRFYAEGPVRFAPAVMDGRVFFASDDGCLYCLDATTGSLHWKHRASPRQRNVLGNGRLISVWPVRGAPVAAGGRVYLAAGVWPFEGIFVWALDAATGEPLWVNDRSGSLYLEHPHAAMAFGGPSPQGYLLIRGDQLVVPSSRAFPASFDLETGELNHFDFGHGGHGSRPGSWFVATDPAGEMLVDPQINTEIHDAGQQVIGQSGVRPQDGEVLPERVTIGRHAYRLQPGAASSASLGGSVFRFDDGYPGVQGDIHTMFSADGKLFVVTREGSIYCFGPQPAEPATYSLATQPLEPTQDRWTDRAATILRGSGADAGYAVVLGMGTGRLAEELTLQSDLHVIVVEPDAERVDGWRRRLDRAGLYGHRIVVHVADPLQFPLPPYLAELIVCEEPPAADSQAAALLEKAFAALRPYGGTFCLELSDAGHEALVRSSGEAGLQDVRFQRLGDLTLIARAGALPGAADYRGQPNFDRRVRAPLGLLWFGDTLHHHKLFYRSFTHEGGRGLPTTIEVAGGVMKYEVTEEPYGPNPRGIGYFDYLRILERDKTYREACTDIYTGRVLSEAEAERAAAAFSAPEAARLAPESPAAAFDSADAETDLLPLRTNPLTGLREAREIFKTYGCDLYPVDYGQVSTMRSGTAAYYDKRLESGTISISGVRSGCRNSIIPAGGVLSLPSWTGNCTCNYPVYTSLALVAMPADFEQWSAWGDVAVEAPIRRVGINLGAPGNRVSEDGTLWLEYPKVGGPSPRVPVQTVPENARGFYRHAMWMQGGDGSPWITASGLQGLQSLRIEPVALRSAQVGNTFSVRWLGSVQPQHSETYTFHARTDHALRLWVADEMVLDNSANLRRGDRGEVSVEIALEAGQRYPIKMEYQQPTDRAEPALAELAWSSASVARSVIPPEALFTAEGQAGGLTGMYYATAGLSGPAALQTDPQIRFEWGPSLPAVLQPLERPVQLPERSFTVSLYFAEPDGLPPGQRVFSVRLQGQEVLNDFDVAREADGPDRGLVRHFSGVRVKQALEIELVTSTDKPAILCGVEMIEEVAAGAHPAAEPAGPPDR